MGNQIVFLLTRNGEPGQWLINSDGSNLHRVISRGIWATWSADGRWIYFVALRGGKYRIEKVSLDGREPVIVRDDAVDPAADSLKLYYANVLKRGDGGWDYEVCKSGAEDGPTEVLARIAGQRVPVKALNFHTILSPDGKLLAMPLTDAGTSNLWVLPTIGGPIRQLTDFGKRPIVIARRVSWSPDSKYLYAAVDERDSDVVLLDGLRQVLHGRASGSRPDRLRVAGRDMPGWPRLPGSHHWHVRDGKHVREWYFSGGAGETRLHPRRSPEQIRYSCLDPAR